LETLSVVEYGWRYAAEGVGILAGSILMLSSLFLLSQPEDYSMVEKSTSANDISPTSSSRCDDSFTFEEAVRTSLLWSLMFCWFVSCVPWAGINFLLVTILKEDHYSQGDSVFVYVMLGICSAVSALVCGVIEDRIPHSKKQFSVALVNGAMLFAVVVGALLHRINGPLGPVLLGCGLGTWEGFSNVVGTTIIPHLYGRRHQGKIRGLFMASAQVSSGAGPLIISLGRDIGLSMALVCSALAMFQVFAIVLIIVVPRPLHRPNGSASLTTSFLSA
jgi:MFS family permease